MTGISYELAAELKDTGFNVEDKPIGSFEGEHHFMGREEFFVKDGDQVDVPTLSELIEACGEEILGINRTHNDQGTPDGWIADTHTHHCECGKENCKGFNWEHKSGSTPEEAVARLWLALNTK